MTQSEHFYDLFISFSEADRAWVEGYLLDALKAAGVRVHSEAAFTLGAPRLLEFRHKELSVCPPWTIPTPW